MQKGQFGKKDVEDAVIGGFIVDGDLELFGLEDIDFYFEDNKKVFQAIKKLKDDNSKIDLLTLSNQLDEDGELENIGGNPGLIEYTNSVVSTVHQEEYVNILKNETKRIRLYKLGQKIMFHSENSENINGETINFANECLSIGVMKSNDYNITNQLGGFIDYLDARKGKGLFGWSWGFNFLDEATDGLQPGICYRIGAPSNTGKTQFVYSQINNLVKQGAKVLFFTLEMNANFTLSSILSNHQQTSRRSIEKGEVQPDVEYLEKLDGKLFLVDDIYNLGEIFSKVLEIKPDVVFLDFIGQVKIKGFPKEKMFDEYAGQVKEFVKKTNITWIDLSNMTKAEQGDEFAIRQGGFNGSQDLKNLADIGIHFYENKDFKEFKATAVEMGAKQWLDYSILNIVVTKNRIGNKPEALLKVNFSKGGEFKVIDKQELENYKNKLF